MTREQAEASMKEILPLVESGFAGVLPSGKIVDRREHPEATAIQANGLLDVPPPRSLRDQAVLDLAKGIE